MKQKITQQYLGELRPGNYDVGDAQQPGLFLRVRASGEHSWLVRIGKQWLTLGLVADLPPGKARGLAQNARTLKAEGGDPFAAKRTARLKAATLRDFATGHYQEWAGTHHRDAAASVARVLAAFADFADKPLPAITAFAVERWRAARRKDKIAATTTNREIALLKGVLSRAIELGAMRGPNPLTTVKPVSVDPLARVRYLSPAEEARLLKALEARETKMRAARASFNKWRTDRSRRPIPDYPADRYVDHVQPLVLLAMHTGARRGELLALRWADVDLVSNMVTFRGTTTKTARTRRVPLNETAVAALRRWAPEHVQADALVFPGDRGKPMASVKTAFENLLKDAKITGFRFHDLRHHAASRMVQAGTDLYVVSEILGHQSMTMTRRYAHLRDADKAAAVATIATGARS